MLYFLIGYMGSGKTSLAKRISKLTGIPYIDSDKEIEAIAKLSVAEIFSQHGEKYFRDLEHAFIKSLDPDRKLIISTGGGLPCFNDNMSIIEEKGISFYLKLSPSKLAERLSLSKTERPLLKNRSGKDLIEFLEKHLNEREEFYLRAKYLVDGNRPFEHISTQIADIISL